MNKDEFNLIKNNSKENRRSSIRNMFTIMKQYRVTAKEIQQRKIRVSGTHWVVDFASCNYLGFDLDEEMGSSIHTEIKKWGIHPSWCRLVASPDIYIQLENKIAELIGTEECIIFPTVTLISIGVIPALVGKSGILILDKSSHETMYEGAKIARDNGAILTSYIQDDFSSLEKILKKYSDNPRKVIMVDGVYSMTGDYANLLRIATLAKKYHSLIYIDDAHGFGVIGEKPNVNFPLGKRGNGIVKYFGLDYENIIYVGGCSKAYSSLAAFIACSKDMKTFIEAFASPYDLSGPCPTASLATLMKGLEINEKRGDQRRAILWKLTKKVIDGLRELDYVVQNKTGFPIVSVHIGDTDTLIKTANKLFDEGILVTVAPYPMVKKGNETLRITVTAANTETEVDQLLCAFNKIRICMK